MASSGLAHKDTRIKSWPRSGGRLQNKGRSAVSSGPVQGPRQLFRSCPWQFQDDFIGQSFCLA
eukprot:9006279-Pyramimonas_sp.AAC.1